MEIEEFKNWVKEIKTSKPVFLDRMQGKERKGFFKYSLSGDLLSEKFRWGLGNSVFALKSYYTLNIKYAHLNELIDYIQSFQNRNGEFYDPFIKYLSFHKRIYQTLKCLDFNNFFNTWTIRAETRQSISALRLYGIKPKYQYTCFPQNKKDIAKYLIDLDWNKPWAAGSHFSHLLFFLSHSGLRDKLNLIDFAVKWANKIQNKDGCWYSRETSLQQKINGAMKIISGLKVATSLENYNKGNIYFDYAKELIDTSLRATHIAHACDNFNITYVLRYANEVTEGQYRYAEIENFMKERLDLYKNFYHPEHKAFSFYPNKANKYYYGALIAKGKNEPDIHGTTLFLWGLSVIGNFFGINKELDINEFIP